MTNVFYYDVGQKRVDNHNHNVGKDEGDLLNTPACNLIPLCYCVSVLWECVVHKYIVSKLVFIAINALYICCKIPYKATSLFPLYML